MNVRGNSVRIINILVAASAAFFAMFTKNIV